MNGYAHFRKHPYLELYINHHDTRNDDTNMILVIIMPINFTMINYSNHDHINENANASNDRSNDNDNK
jgi:hypothetical protein